jgi:hypothetical protein
MTLLASVLGPLAHPLLATVADGINSVGGSVPGLAMGATPSSVLAQMAVEIRAIFTVVAAIIICIAGYRMIIGQEDDAVEKAKTTINLAVVGIALAWLAPSFVMAFFGTSGEVIRNSAASGASVLSTQIYYLISLVIGVAAPLAVLAIVISAAQALAKGTDDGITTMRRAILAASAGIILLLAREVLGYTFSGQGTGMGNINPSPQSVRGSCAHRRGSQCDAGFFL